MSHSRGTRVLPYWAFHENALFFLLLVKGPIKWLYNYDKQRISWLLTHFLKIFSQIPILDEMEWQRRGFTSSGDSWMESCLLRQSYVWGFLITWDNNLPISRQKHYLNNKSVKYWPTIIRACVVCEDVTDYLIKRRKTTC